MKFKTIIQVKYKKMDSWQESIWYAAIDLLIHAGGLDLQLQAEQPKGIIRTNIPEVLSEIDAYNIIPTS